MVKIDNANVPALFPPVVTEVIFIQVDKPSKTIWWLDEVLAFIDTEAYSV